MLENLEYLPENPQSSLLHMDNRLENLILEEDGSEVIGFLDWNFARAGHNELDLIRTEYLLIDYELDLEVGLNEDEKEMMRDKLFKGYQETHEVEMDEEFEVRREVYRYSTVLWLLAGFPNWSSGWDEEARQDMEENLLERLENEHGL
jgi:aminoglycoside phosphotransferase (APT) family kinase protein